MKIFVTGLFLAFSCVASAVEAVCTGSSPTWLSTPDETSVQDCANRARRGDTIQVESGSASWKYGVTIPTDKQLVIQGAGIDETTIATQGAYAFDIKSGNKRITGLTFIISAGKDAVRIDGDGWRVDHIKAISANTSLTNGVQARGLRTNVPNGPTGLVDHVEFIDARLLVVGYPDPPEKSGFLWSSPLSLGKLDAVYLEDSTIIRTIGAANVIDCNYGGRYVMRFTATRGSSIDAHSAQQGMRSCRQWEIYGNMVGFDRPFFSPLFIRGGTGVIFGNTIAGGWTEPYLSFDNRRSFEPHGSMGQCAGTSPADGNQQSQGQLAGGWPCRDQIGWAQDASQWTLKNSPPPQMSTPAYLWDNTIGGSRATVRIRNGSGPWIQANRDYYNHTDSFDGTVGVGVGPLAFRPDTCTPGVAYWATDEGEWNSLQSGRDGQLYKCTATDSWTLYYRPFSYPHPLQKATESPTMPRSPKNLTITD